jgi:hypothetical protein
MHIYLQAMLSLLYSPSTSYFQFNPPGIEKRRKNINERHLILGTHNSKIKFP